MAMNWKKIKKGLTVFGAALTLLASSCTSPKQASVPRGFDEFKAPVKTISELPAQKRNEIKYQLIVLNGIMDQVDKEFAGLASLEPTAASSEKEIILKRLSDAKKIVIAMNRDVPMGSFMVRIEDIEKSI